MGSAVGKVLVTGANGFTGTWFCEYLAKRGVPTRGTYYAPDGAPPFSHPNLELVPGDLLDRESLKRALHGVEIVQNIAALYRPTNVPQKAYWDVNVNGLRNIVEEAAKAGVKRFVQCSTIGVHGDVRDPPATENAPIKPDDYYQETKYQGEMVARELCPALGMAFSVVRPAAIYGPRETRFLKLAKALKRSTFIMFGTGEVRYHFHPYRGSVQRDVPLCGAGRGARRGFHRRRRSRAQPQRDRARDLRSARYQATAAAAALFIAV